MKRISWTLILPLTIISFSIFTKWWYVLPVDAPDSMMYGFPLPYACNGWHTSLSYQIYIIELLLDLLIYYTFWFIIVKLTNRYIIKISMHRIATIILLSFAGLFATGFIFIASNSTNTFKSQRPFDVEVLKTGYKFVWDAHPRPESFNEYKQKKE